MADIIDTAVAAGQFTTLARALQAAGLVDTLKGPGPFTVFAPTDAAFAKLPAGTLDALLADPAQLRAVLTYHVVPGRVTVRYGFSGRVLLGQKGQSGRVALPVNVFVADAKRERIVNDKAKVEVDVAVDNPIGYFSVVRSVTFNIPEGSRPGEYEVFVGFDRTVPGAG